MELVTLIPGILCIFALIRGGAQYAVQNVYLPVLLLLPTYFIWTMRPLPSMNFVEATAIPLLIGIPLLNIRHWRPSRGDVWMAIFIFSSSYSEYRNGRSTEATFLLFANITTGLVPYMIGKLTIEQTGARIEFVKRFVFVLFAGSALSMYEYVYKNNLYSRLVNHFYPGQWSGWETQLRWGFGRVAGPFSQSELAGIIYSAGLLLALWLTTKGYFRGVLRFPKLVVAVLLAVLLSTQARGPWLGTIVALAIASIGNAKRPLRRAALVVSVTVLVVIPAYTVGKNYLQGPRTDYGSERETAQYRQELLQNYLPIGEVGGAWGWGSTFPHVNGQISIDNEYLFIDLVQGYVGFFAFVLLIVEAVVALVGQGILARTRADRHFAFTLLAIVLGTAFTIATVFLGSQTYEMFFLLIGWAQAVRPQHETVEIAAHADTNEEPYQLFVYS
jgi:hypothetical protein